MSYTEFGCNEGNVFFMGIDNWNTNADVIYFDSVAGIQYPGVSGTQGGGGAVHESFNIQATPAIVVITPDKHIFTKQISPSTTQNVVDSVLLAGGILQPCTTSIPETESKNTITVGPNPVRNNAYMHLYINKPGKGELAIYNLTGQKVFSQEPGFYYPGNYTIVADLSKEPNGFYFVQYKDEAGGVVTKKIILTD